MNRARDTLQIHCNPVAVWPLDQQAPFSLCATIGGISFRRLGRVRQQRVWAVRVNAVRDGAGNICTVLHLDCQQDS